MASPEKPPFLVGRNPRVAVGAMSPSKEHLEQKRLLEDQLYLIDRTIDRTRKVRSKRRGGGGQSSASAADLAATDGDRLPEIKPRMPRSNSDFMSQTGGKYTGRRIPGREDELRARDKTLGRRKRREPPAAPTCPPLNAQIGPAKAFGANSIATHARLKNLMREVDSNLVKLTLPATVVDHGGWYVATRSTKPQMRDKSHANPLIASRSWLQA